METNRFETFYDAIIAIVITVLVLKIPQPASPTLTAFLELKTMYTAYFISFLILYNLWYANHNLFHLVETIDNRTLWIYGIMTFVISLIPYFTIWLANNPNSIATETMFGVIFIVTHLLNTLATRAIYKSNPYNKNLQEFNHNSYYMNLPLILIMAGFVLTYTTYIKGIYFSCLISIVLWILIGRLIRRDSNGN